MDSHDSGLRGDPGVDRTPIDGTRDPHAAAASSADPIPSETDPPKVKVGTLGIPLHLRREPTPQDFADPRFDVLWELMKRVDVDFRNGLFSDATGNDVCAVLDALDAVKDAADPALRERHDIDPAEGRVVSVFSDGSYLLDTPSGTRKHFFFNADPDPALRTLSQQKDRLQGQLDAFLKIHEHWEFEEGMTEAEFDDWLHKRIKSLRHQMSLLTPTDDEAADLDRVCPLIKQEPTS